MHNTHDNSILLQKFRPPSQQIKLCERTDLINKVAHHAKTSLCLLNGPAGFGKSTLLIQYLDDWLTNQTNDNAKAIWISLDANDNEANQFFRLISHALVHFKQADPSLINHANIAASSRSITQFSKEIMSLITKIISPLLIVFDDFHFIDQPLVLEFISQLQLYKHNQTQLLIGSRNQPATIISDLFAKGAVFEINAKQLKFTFAETERVMADVLSKSQISEFYHRAEGWPVAIQMARLWCEQHNNSEVVDLLNLNIDVLSRYFSDQVFSRFNEDVKTVLLSTSFLSRFDVYIADEICQTQNSHQLFAGLSDYQALIIPLDTQGKSFRYHYLFSDFLQQTLLFQKGEPYLQMLRCRAANAYFKKNELLEAICHCVRAQNISLAIKLLNDAGSWSLIMTQGIGIIESVLNQFSDDTIQKSPTLGLIKSYMYLKFGQLQQAKNYFEVAHQIHLDSQHTQLGSDSSDRDFIVMEQVLQCYLDKEMDERFIKRNNKALGKISEDDHIAKGTLLALQILALNQVGQFDEAEKMAQLCLIEMRVSQCWVGVNYALFHHGLSLMYQGRISEAMSMFSDTSNMAKAHFGLDSGLLHMADCFCAYLYYIQNDLVKAQQLLDSGMKVLEQRDCWVELYYICYHLAVHLALAKNNFDLALSHINRGLKVASHRHLPRLDWFLEVLELKIHIAAKSTPNSISTWVALTRKPRESNFWLPDIMLLLTLANYYLDKNDNTNAIKLSEKALKYASSINLLAYVVKAKSLLSLAHINKGDEKLGFKLLQDAIHLSASHNLQRIFLDLPQSIESSLMKLKSNQSNYLLSLSEHQFISNILLAMQNNQTPSMLNIILSHREHQIAQLLTIGKTNKEIALDLGISTNTVKFHLKNVFQKLGVKNRAQASIAMHKAAVEQE